MKCDLKTSIKIQQEMLKALATGNYNKIWGEYDDETMAISWDGFRVHLVPKEHFFLDLSAIIHKTDSIDILFKDYENAKPAKETGAVRIDKKVLVKLEADDGSFAYYDEKMMKFFPKGCDCYIVNNVKPIFVKNDDDLVGLVLPVRYEG